MKQKFALMSMVLSLAGCPGDDCEKSSDCGSGEYCSYAEDAGGDKRKMCIPVNVNEGDSGGGWRVRKVRGRLGPIEVEAEKD